MTSLVVAAQAGDRRALDELVAECLPLVYNIVDRALSGHPDGDDVVQETMLRAVRELGTLRTPESFRTWLVTIAVHQIATHGLKRRVTDARTVALDDVAEATDAGFEDLTILRVGLSGQRRQVARASRWLDPDDRAMLSLWWMENAGHLTRREVAAAMGLTVAHAGVRIQRIRNQLDLSRALVAALEASPRCAGLTAAVADWDGLPSPLWRKRLARHTRSCGACARAAVGMVPAKRLLAGLALAPVPVALAAAVLAKSALSTTIAGTVATAASSGAIGTGVSLGLGAGAKAGVLGRLAQVVGAHPVVAACAVGAIAAGSTVVTTPWTTPLPRQPAAIVSPGSSPRSAPATASRTTGIPGIPGIPGTPRTPGSPSPTAAAPPTTGAASLPLGPVSLESVEDAGRFVAYVGDYGVLTPVGADTGAAARQQATFVTVPGLADSECFSLRAQDGRYLRHMSWRLRLMVDEGTVLFREDATFCARTGSVPGSVLLESSNYPGWFLRQVGDELWVDRSDGSSRFRATSSFRVRAALAG